MLKSYIHPRLGEIKISETRRARRVSLSVHPSGRIRLSFPPYISLKRALAFLESKVDWVEATLLKYKDRPTTPKPTADQIEQLRHKAKDYLPQRLEELSRLTGLNYNKVTIRAARTKWGSCTAQNNISLSLYLMTLPSHLIDYVLIHELCHTIHHNHSPKFHALLDRLLGGREKIFAKELRQYSIP